MDTIDPRRLSVASILNVTPSLNTGQISHEPDAANRPVVRHRTQPTSGDTTLPLKKANVETRVRILACGPEQTSIRKHIPMRSEKVRRQVLENDPWVDKVTPHAVVCKGCLRNLALDHKKPYYAGHWKHHRARCQRIRIKNELSGRQQDDGYWDTAPVLANNYQKQVNVEVAATSERPRNLT
ncbi:hypothetical protein VNI00_015507 [Paramarasmius palmivorus]|uniref:Recombination activating protein 1 n=1 Tax=Paramarasmius palmivorus TaxID=297713 RepID=A0AAW0BKN3_9AGAR